MRELVLALLPKFDLALCTPVKLPDADAPEPDVPLGAKTQGRDVSRPNARPLHPGVKNGYLCAASDQTRQAHSVRRGVPGEMVSARYKGDSACDQTTVANWKQTSRISQGGRQCGQ
jgi:hypothetical protein